MNDELRKQLQKILAGLQPSFVGQLGQRTVRTVIQVLSPQCGAVTEAIAGADVAAEIDRKLAAIIEGLLDVSVRQDPQKELQAVRSELESLLAALSPISPPLSPDAERVAVWIARKSLSGLTGDWLIILTDISQECSLSEDETRDAVDELMERGYVREYGLCSLGDALWPENRLFWEVDELAKGWNVLDNAFALARRLVQTGEPTVSLQELHEALGWELRMLNPAATYLIDNGLVDSIPPGVPLEYACSHLTPTHRTRRFIKEKAACRLSE
jgi:hypothetical protein